MKKNTKHKPSPEAYEAAGIIISKHVRHRGYMARIIQRAMDEALYEYAAHKDAKRIAADQEAFAASILTFSPHLLHFLHFLLNARVPKAHFGHIAPLSSR